MGYLEFEVVPEVALKNDLVELMLGMPLNQAIAMLQNAARHIRNIELTYCQKEPLSRDICITLTTDGIRLLFDSRTQRLKIIEVFDLGNIILRYCSNVFSRPRDEANASKVEACFGATHPGVYDEQQRVYMLSWRGLSFCFPMNSDTSTTKGSYAHGLGSLNYSSPPVVTRMSIFFSGGSSNVADALYAHMCMLMKRFRVAPMPLACFCGCVRLLSAEADVEAGKILGLNISFLAQTSGAVASKSGETSLKELHRLISFGDSTQAVLCALGAPSRVFYKCDDRMLIHRGADKERVGGDQADFFFNYFSLGLDILFSASSKRVSKFVLHCNYPGHFDFGIYSRCDFTVSLDDGVSLNSYSKFDEFCNALTASGGDSSWNHPVVLNRSSSTGVENPFGASFCYGVRQMVVEVTENGHIASLTIFQGL